MCARNTSYIVPQYPTVAPFSKRFYPPDMGPITDIPPTGNAPVLLTRGDLLKIIPVWAEARARACRCVCSSPPPGLTRVHLARHRS